MARGKPVYEVFIRGGFMNCTPRGAVVFRLQGCMKWRAGRSSASTVLDPRAKHWKAEFAGARRSFLPTHASAGLEEVEKRGSDKIAVAGGKVENVRPVPTPFATRRDSENIGRDRPAL